MLPILALIALGLLATRKPNKPTDSEDSTGEPSDYRVEMETTNDEPYADLLADSIGCLYYWGKGSPSTPWSDIVNGADCSGAVQMALVRCNLLSATATDRGATQLANDSDPIAVGEQIPGDLAFYAGHVMLVYSYPRSDGHSAVWGAHGGNHLTKGDNPNARIDVMNSALYWPTKTDSNGKYVSGFLTYCRLRK